MQASFHRRHYRDGDDTFYQIGFGSLAAFDAVTLDDVNGLARELWVPERMSAAGVGGDEAAFRSALESVSPALAAA